MGEKIGILVHHVDALQDRLVTIQDRCVGVKEEALKALVEISVIRDISRAIPFTEGVRAYPGLEEPVNFQKTVDARLRAALAIIASNYVLIPDRNPDGTRNFDLICDDCVNSRPDKGMCRITQIGESLYDYGL